MPKKVPVRAFKPFKTKRTLTRVAKRKIFMPKKPKQVFSIANNGRKVRHGVSRAELEWLAKLGVPEKSKVIILFGKTYVVDGFDPKTNTCYEYNGDRFHGSHKVYKINRNIKDRWLGKSPDELYYGTLQRYALFRNVGFKVFFVWESDYKAGKSLGRYYRGGNDNLY